MIAISTTVATVIRVMLCSISVTMSAMVAEEPVTSTLSPAGFPSRTWSRTCAICWVAAGAPVLPGRPTCRYIAFPSRLVRAGSISGRFTTSWTNETFAVSARSRVLRPVK